MSSPIEHDPVASRPIKTLGENVSKLSEILNRNPAPVEDTPEPDVSTEPLEPQQEQVQEQEVSSEPQDVAPRDDDAPGDEDAPAKDGESQDTGEEPTEIGLEAEQIAALLGLSEGDLHINEDGTVSVKVPIDGGSETVSLGEVRDGYKLAKVSKQRLSALGEDRKAFDSERQQALGTLANQYQQILATQQILEEDFSAEHDGVDWQKLRDEDPTEYNLKRADFEDRKQKLAQRRQQVLQQGQQLQTQQLQMLAQQQAAGQAKLGEVFEGESYGASPRWDDAERKRLNDWIAAQGFSQQEINSVGIWQVFKWARDSMLREQELKQAKESMKRVTSRKINVKPGKPKPRQEIQRGRLEELKNRQRKAGGSLKSTEARIRGILNR